MTTDDISRPQFPIPDDPADRPRKARSTVRVIMVNADNETLLFEDSDPGLPEFRWWVTPGGGIDPGESEVDAAVREVAEETGYLMPPEHLLGPVARRHILHGYSDQVIEQDEAFFFARVANFDVDIAGHTEEEQLTLQQSRWWSADELARTDAWIWPAELLQLWDIAGDPSRWPLDLGDQEESTLAVAATKHDS
ncbi:MAG: hypothetical protein JWN06_3143 [Propionibacteriaceae bacterium]|jgi:8-oxo-dGTP pyrophosphatase MutT (NUDIX family)|nr:hypothetical protein [Propionibacteriaceae bacterium]